MSSVAKTSTLRMIIPKTLAQRAIASLGPLGKVDAQELVLDTGRMTTEDVVRYIKEYAKLRDGVSQTLRQLGIERKSESAIPETSDMKTTGSEAETQAAEARSEYQKILSSVEAADRQVQEIEKQVSTLEQLKGTGFSFDEIMSGATGFRRIAQGISENTPGCPVRAGVAGRPRRRRRPSHRRLSRWGIQRRRIHEALDRSKDN